MKKSIAIFFIIAIVGVILGMFVSGEVFPGPAVAQEKYPSKPINLIVGYPAGGTTDLGARALALAAGKILGQPVVILNKPGGASSVAMASLKNEKPDGYTIGILSSGAVLSQHLRKVPYDSAKDYPYHAIRCLSLRAGGTG